MAEFRKSFHAIDTHNTGQITMDDLRAYMHRMNYTEKFVKNWMKLFHPNDDGVITYANYCSTLGLIPRKHESSPVETDDQHKTRVEKDRPAEKENPKETKRKKRKSGSEKPPEKREEPQYEAPIDEVIKPSTSDTVNVSPNLPQSSKQEPEESSGISSSEQTAVGEIAGPQLKLRTRKSNKNKPENTELIDSSIPMDQSNIPVVVGDQLTLVSTEPFSDLIEIPTAEKIDFSPIRTELVMEESIPNISSSVPEKSGKHKKKKPKEKAMVIENPPIADNSLITAPIMEIEPLHLETMENLIEPTLDLVPETVQPEEPPLKSKKKVKSKKGQSPQPKVDQMKAASKEAVVTFTEPIQDMKTEIADNFDMDLNAESATVSQLEKDQHLFHKCVTSRVEMRRAPEALQSPVEETVPSVNFEQPSSEVPLSHDKETSKRNKPKKPRQHSSSMEVDLAPTSVQPKQMASPNLGVSENIELTSSPPLAVNPQVTVEKQTPPKVSNLKSHQGEPVVASPTTTAIDTKSKRKRKHKDTHEPKLSTSETEVVIKKNNALKVTPQVESITDQKEILETEHVPDIDQGSYQKDGKYSLFDKHHQWVTRKKLRHALRKKRRRIRKLQDRELRKLETTDSVQTGDKTSKSKGRFPRAFTTQVKGNTREIKKQRRLRERVVNRRADMVQRLLKPKSKKSKKSPKPKWNLRPSLQGRGMVLVLLAGIHRGKRVVCLGRHRASGLLLITGPYRYNGCPLRRVNPTMVIATKTRINLKNLKLPPRIHQKEYFARKRVKKSDSEGELNFIAGQAKDKPKYTPSEHRKEDQLLIDKAVCEALKAEEDSRMLIKYLKSLFSIGKYDKPHNMVF